MNREQLVQQIFQKKTFLCVGLDPDIKKLPPHLLDEEDPIFAFNRQIIDATAPYSVAFKPNLAFYESTGIKGLMAFEKTVQYIRSHHPDLFIIADAKRGDIGNTSAMYAQTFFDEYNVDALTVAPYMGEDSVQPFLQYKNKWTILLALTSNKGSHDFQFTESEGTPLWEKVITKSQSWGSEENLMFVVGATQGEMFREIRRVAPKSFLLVPGVGAQGGSLQAVCQYGITKDCGLLVNSSRGIIYAAHDQSFAQAAAAAAQALQQEMAAQLALL